MTEPEYIAYFERLARLHKAINHHEAQPAFFVVHDGTVAEVEQAVRSKLHLPALLLDQYFDDLDNESDNYRLTIQGGLSVICKVEVGNVKSIRAARDEARRIARSILNRIRRDCRTPGSDLYAHRITPSISNQGEKTDMIAGGTATGWGYPFSLLMPTTVKIDPEDWSDLSA